MDVSRYLTARAALVERALDRLLPANRTRLRDLRVGQPTSADTGGRGRPPAVGENLVWRVGSRSLYSKDADR